MFCCFWQFYGLNIFSRLWSQIPRCSFVGSGWESAFEICRSGLRIFLVFLLSACASSIQSFVIFALPPSLLLPLRLSPPLPLPPPLSPPQVPAAQAAVARRRGRAFMTRRTKSKCLCSPKGPRRNNANPGSCFWTRNRFVLTYFAYYAYYSYSAYYTYWTFLLQELQILYVCQWQGWGLAAAGWKTWHGNNRSGRNSSGAVAAGPV